VALIDWALGALIIAAACFVMGLAGFGVALVAMAFLPYVMAPATAIVLLTVYTVPFSLAIFVQLRRHFTPRAIVDLLIGTALGTPIGVFILTALPASTLNRVIGAFLVVIVILEWRQMFPEQLTGRGWGLLTGVLAGVLGGAVGTPGPPVVVYSTTQGWSPRTMKANLQAFFIVNQALILIGYWWTGLLTREVWQLAAGFALPAIAGALVGVALFGRIDAARFRRVVFALLFLSGLVLLVRG